MKNKPKRIFLIIGLTKESAHWDDAFLKMLKKCYQTELIIGLDLPGAGQLLNSASPTSIEGIVKVTREHYQQYFNENEEYENILISISLGGMVATQWGKSHPSDFAKLIIINSSFKGLSPVYKRIQPKAIFTFLKVLLMSDNASRESLILKLCGNNKKNYQATHQKWVQIADQRPMTKCNMIRQMIAAARFRLDHKPNMPVLIIAAKHDRLAHYSCSKNLQKVWRKDLYLLPEKYIGHGVHIDAPCELAKLIYDWSENNAVTAQEEKIIDG